MEIKPIILLMSSLCSVLFPRSGSSPAGLTSAGSLIKQAQPPSKEGGFVI